MRPTPSPPAVRRAPRPDGGVARWFFRLAGRWIPSCLLALLPAAVPGAEEPGSLHVPPGDTLFVVDQFDYPDAVGAAPPTWEGRSGWRQTLARPEEIYYKVTAEGDNLFLRGETTGMAVNFGLGVDANLRLHNRLRWRWRVHALPEGGNEEVQERNDSAAAVRLVFQGGLIPKTLKYVWSATLPAGTLTESPSNNRTKVIVLRSGSGQLGEWLWEDVDAYQDYKRAFGGEPRKVRAFAVLTDSDNTGSSVRADYDDISFWISASDSTGQTDEPPLPDDSQETAP